MIVYFDESYSPAMDIVIFGAVFLGKNSHRKLRNVFIEIKKKHKLKGKELKYSKLDSRNKTDAAKEIIAKFFEFSQPYFRACIVPYSNTGLSKIPGTSLGQKRVDVYVSSATTLILNNIGTAYKSELYLDEEQKIAKTKLLQKLERIRPQSGGRVKSAIQIKSNDEIANVLQITDLLLGAVYQGIHRSNSRSSRYKAELSDYVAELAGFPNYQKTYWNKGRLSDLKRKHPKFCLSYWKPPARWFRKK